MIPGVTIDDPMYTEIVIKAMQNVTKHFLTGVQFKGFSGSSATLFQQLHQLRGNNQLTWPVPVYDIRVLSLLDAQRFIRVDGLHSGILRRLRVVASGVAIETGSRATRPPGINQVTVMGPRRGNSDWFLLSCCFDIGSEHGIGNHGILGWRSYWSDTDRFLIPFLDDRISMLFCSVNSLCSVVSQPKEVQCFLIPPVTSGHFEPLSFLFEIE